LTTKRRRFSDRQISTRSPVWRGFMTCPSRMRVVPCESAGSLALKRVRSTLEDPGTRMGRNERE